MDVAPQDGFLTTPTTGLEVGYRDWIGPAGGRAPVLLLHGLASSRRIFDLCAPILAQTRRVVAYDQRGHGETAKPGDGYNTDTFVADGVGVTRALRVAEPYIVVGHSWGASIALAWAARHPDFVRAIVLVDGAIFPFREVPGATWQKVSARMAPPDLSGLSIDDLLGHARGSLHFLDETVLRAHLEALFSVRDDGTILPRLSRENHMRILRTMWDEDVDAAFAAVRCHVLALLAERETVNPESRQMETLRHRMVDRLQRAQSLLTVRWLRDTIHDVPLQRPAELAEAILSVDV
jgi:pimeloyl-ACP methyl ester carboxylesterase